MYFSGPGYRIWWHPRVDPSSVDSLEDKHSASAIYSQIPWSSRLSHSQRGFLGLTIYIDNTCHLPAKLRITGAGIFVCLVKERTEGTQSDFPSHSTFTKKPELLMLLVPLLCRLSLNYQVHMINRFEEISSFQWIPWAKKVGLYIWNKVLILNYLLSSSYLFSFPSFYLN